MARYYAKIVSPDRRVQYAYRFSRYEIRYVPKLARKLGNKVEVYKLTKI